MSAQTEERARAALLKNGPFQPGTRRLLSTTASYPHGIWMLAARFLNADYFTYTRYIGVGQFQRNVYKTFAAACADAVGGDGRGMVYVVHDGDRADNIPRQDWALLRELAAMAEAGE